jgi:nucleoredoxin
MTCFKPKDSDSDPKCPEFCPIKLFGEELVKPCGATVKTTEAITGDTKAIGIYFSANWCAPCRAFTPKLAEQYTNTLKGMGMEIVFASSDRDKDGFKDYFKEMPWLALPYCNRDLKEQLSRKYKVQGIPSLVIIDAKTGELNTKEGRSAIANVEDFPFKEKKICEILKSMTFVKKCGAELKAEDVLNKGAIGLYFSGHWCPPCRNFTPKLVETYEKVKKKNPEFEIIFVSSDHDEASFKEYFQEMPWIALRYSDRKQKEQISNYFDVDGIPAFVMLCGNSFSTINANARSAISADPEGVNYPWYPPLVQDIGKGQCDGIQDGPCLILLGETLCEEGRKKLWKEAEIVSQEYKTKAKEAGESDPEIRFLINTVATAELPADGPMSRVSQLAGLAPCTERAGKECAPTALLFDLEDQGSFYEAKGPMCSAKMRQFLCDYKSGKLEKKKLS